MSWGPDLVDLSRQDADLLFVVLLHFLLLLPDQFFLVEKLGLECSHLSLFGHQLVVLHGDGLRHAVPSQGRGHFDSTLPSSTKNVGPTEPIYEVA